VTKQERTEGGDGGMYCMLVYAKRRVCGRRREKDRARVVKSRVSKRDRENAKERERM